MKWADVLTDEQKRDVGNLQPVMKAYAAQEEKETKLTITGCDAAKHALMDVNG